jgi:hypothetical protein
VEAARHFLPLLSGDFGISWDAWPVTLAKYAAAMRSGERSFLAAETPLARAAAVAPDLRVKTRREHDRAEWDLTMLADHAWNGDAPANRTVNANLRRHWGEELDHPSSSLQDQAGQAAGLAHNSETLALFNSLSLARADLVRAEVPDANRFAAGIASQVVMEDGQAALYFVSPAIPAFQFSTIQLPSRQADPQRTPAMRAIEYELESPLYRLRVDPQTGGIASLLDKRANREIVISGKASLGQTVFFDGQAHPLRNVHSEVVTQGPVLARLKVVGTTEGIQVTNQITLYAALDRVDLDI